MANIIKLEDARSPELIADIESVLSRVIDQTDIMRLVNAMPDQNGKGELIEKSIEIIRDTVYQLCVRDTNRAANHRQRVVQEFSDWRGIEK